jgi:hypothetical protein
MIKKGDEVVCIKSFFDIYLANEIYVIDDKSGNDLFIAEINHYGRYGFSIDYSSISLLFEEYFMTLAEWREQQMKDILKDE